MTEQQQPWQWDEPAWRGHVAHVRAGRPLRPASWPGGARVAVALSFDSDHETPALRDGEVLRSPTTSREDCADDRPVMERTAAVLGALATGEA